jgi:endonuclease/exonuclease/phosphatase family metal-dependent hydrolase
MPNSMRQVFADMDDCATGLSLDRLGRLHRWGVDGDYHSAEPDVQLERPAPLSLRELCRRHERTLRFLWLNTFLMPEYKLDAFVTTKSVLDAAPARMARSHEIGEMIRDEQYDVAALCEAWTDDSRTAILNNWNPWPVWVFGSPSSEMTFRAEVYVPGVTEIVGLFGGETEWTILTVGLLSSGLFTLLPGSFGLVAHARETFGMEGLMTRDADYFSNKGILLVVVETGHNTKIEFYSAHLISGNDLIAESGNRETVVARVATAQIDQLVDAINRTHIPSNVIVVAGDFNISDSGALTEYLRKRMEDDLQLEDVWTRYAEARYGATRSGTFSNAAFPDEPNPAHREYMCDIAGPGECSACPAAAGAPPCPGYEEGAASRVDHVYVQKPSSGHDICLNVSRPRRRHFKREGSSPGFAEIATLSDHVGIEMNLFFAGKHKPADPHID